MRIVARNQSALRVSMQAFIEVIQKKAPRQSCLQREREAERSQASHSLKVKRIVSNRDRVVQNRQYPSLLRIVLGPGDRAVRRGAVLPVRILRRRELDDVVRELLAEDGRLEVGAVRNS